MILRKAHDHPVNTQRQAVSVWAEVLGLDPPSGTRSAAHVEDEVTALHRDLREQVSAVEQAVEGTEIAPLFAPLASITRGLTGPAQILMDWNQLKQNHFQPQFLAGWEWAAVALPY